MSDEIVDVLKGIDWNLVGLDSEISGVAREIKRQTIANLAIKVMDTAHKGSWEDAVRIALTVYQDLELAAP